MKTQRNYKWLFIGQIPILLESQRLAKQLKIEFWLNSEEVLKQLKLKVAAKKCERNFRMNYIA